MEMRFNHERLKIWMIGFVGISCLLLVGCGPQHHYAFEQFSSPEKGAILSIQGYVVVPSEVAEFEENWNILSGEMKKKAGFRLSSLSSGVGGSKLVLAHSEWENLEALRGAFSDKRILELEAKLPKKQFEHLFGLGALGYHTKK